MCFCFSFKIWSESIWFRAIVADAVNSLFDLFPPWWPWLASKFLARNPIKAILGHQRFEDIAGLTAIICSLLDFFCSFLVHSKLCICGNHHELLDIVFLSSRLASNSAVLSFTEVLVRVLIQNNLTAAVMHETTRDTSGIYLPWLSRPRLSWLGCSSYRCRPVLRNLQCHANSQVHSTPWWATANSALIEEIASILSNMNIFLVPRLMITNMGLIWFRYVHIELDSNYILIMHMKCRPNRTRF